jgi:hypothetical protein
MQCAPRRNLTREFKLEPVRRCAERRSCRTALVNLGDGTRPLRYLNDANWQASITRGSCRSLFPPPAQHLRTARLRYCRVASTTQDRSREMNRGSLHRATIPRVGSHSRQRIVASRRHHVVSYSSRALPFSGVRWLVTNIDRRRAAPSVPTAMYASPLAPHLRVCAAWTGERCRIRHHARQGRCNRSPPEHSRLPRRPEQDCFRSRHALAEKAIQGECAGFRLPDCRVLGGRRACGAVCMSQETV